MDNSACLAKKYTMTLDRRVRILDAGPALRVNGRKGVRFQIRYALFRKDKTHLNEAGSAVVKGLMGKIRGRVLRGGRRRFDYDEEGRKFCVSREYLVGFRRGNFY